MKVQNRQAASGISIQEAQTRDLDQIADIYYRYMRGDFVGSCGRHVFINYLNYLSDSPKGSLWCALNRDGRVVGFIAGVIDGQQMNRQWVLSNSIQLIAMVVARFFSSHDFREFLFRRISDKFKNRGKIAVISSDNNKVRRDRLAYLKWLAVDEYCRGAGVATQLLTSIECDLKSKGADLIYSFVEIDNTSSKSVHLKNNWKIVAENMKRIKMSKHLV